MFLFMSTAIPLISWKFFWNSLYTHYETLYNRQNILDSINYHKIVDWNNCFFMTRFSNIQIQFVFKTSTMCSKIDLKKSEWVSLEIVILKCWTICAWIIVSFCISFNILCVKFLILPMIFTWCNRCSLSWIRLCVQKKKTQVFCNFFSHEFIKHVY